MTEAALACEFDDCEQPAIADLHFQQKGCLYVCGEHRDELMGQSNWVLHELGAHQRVVTPVWSSGWRDRNGAAIEIDGTPARERVWRP